MRLFRRRPKWVPTVPSLVDFLRCGGSVTLEEWAAMGDRMRAGLAEAATRVEASRAAATGMAAWGEEYAAAVNSPADDGSWARRLMLQRAADRAAGKVRAV